MAGGVIRGIGVTFLVLGIVLVFGGAAAAALGWYVLEDQAEAGPFGDPEARAWGNAAFEGGLVAGAVGLILLVVAAVLLPVGASLAQRELLAAIRAGPATGAPASAPARRAPWVAAGVVALLLLGTLVAFAMEPRGAGGALTRTSGAAPGEEFAAPLAESFEGRVQGAAVPLVGSLTTNAPEAEHAMRVAPGRYDGRALLAWTPTGATGAAELALVVEARTDAGWEELARGEGGPDLEVALPARELPADIRARVFVAGAGAAEQAYTLTIELRRA